MTSRQTILQSEPWARFQRALGCKVVQDNGDGWSWLAYEQQVRGLRSLYAPYGPVADSPQSWNQAMESLLGTARRRGMDFVRIEPTTDFDLTGLGAVQVPEVQPQRTAVLDLTKSVNTLRKNVSQSNRNLINTADDRHITITSTSEPTEAQLTAFYAMLSQTAEAAGFPIHEYSYYRQTLAVMGKTKNATLYVASVGNKPVSAAIALDYETTRFYAHAASYPNLNREHKAAGPKNNEYQ